MGISYAVCRSNSFRVKDDKRFTRWCAFYGLEHWTDPPDDREGTWHNIGNRNGDGWPNSHPETSEDIEFEEEVQIHLHPGTVALLVTVVHQGLAIAGYASALHADGRTVCFTLSYIADMARNEFGPDVTITEASF